MCGAKRFHIFIQSSSQVRSHTQHRPVQHLAKKARALKHKLCCECICAYHETVKEISYSTSPNSRFHFSPYQFLFPRIHFSLSTKKKSLLVCCFLSFFPTGTSLKHLRNLSTGVSHSSSNCGTNKTIIAKRSFFIFQKNIYFFKLL